MGTTSRLLSALGRMLRPARTDDATTRAVTPSAAKGLVLSYAPDRDGAPDAGEIVWTWVPYDENDGRGKDRPVLVIARQSADRVYAVRLTSHAHERDGDYLELGPGEWDGEGRSSWLDLSHLYSVHVKGMRREAAALDARRFGLVVDALHRRYGWRGAR